MKTENWKLKIVFFFLLFTPLQAVLALELQVPIGTKTSVSNLAEYIKAIYEFGVAGAGILAAIMIMVGGFLWLTAAGNATQVGNAKSYISSAILGLVLALTSYMILNLINPKLVSLEMPTITPVAPMESKCCLAADGRAIYVDMNKEETCEDKGYTANNSCGNNGCCYSVKVDPKNCTVTSKEDCGVTENKSDPNAEWFDTKDSCISKCTSNFYDTNKSKLPF